VIVLGENRVPDNRNRIVGLVLPALIEPDAMNRPPIVDDILAAIMIEEHGSGSAV